MQASNTSVMTERIPGPKQTDFICTSHAPINIAYGPVSTGKSFAMAYRAVNFILNECPPGKGKNSPSFILMTAQSVDNLYNNIVSDVMGIAGDRFIYVGNPPSIIYPQKNIKVICSGALDEGDFKRISGPSYESWFATEMHFLPRSFYLIAFKGCRPGVKKKFFDFNTADPRHYLKTKILDNDRLKKLIWFFTFDDNPTMTPEAIEELKASYAGTGWMYRRYILGEWCSGAEGSIYLDVWDENVHCIPQFEIPRNWPRWRVVDFGYKPPKHAFVCQWWVGVPSGVRVPLDDRNIIGPCFIRYKELYTCLEQDVVLAQVISQMSVDDPHTRADYADSADKKGIDTLNAHGSDVRFLGVKKHKKIEKVKTIMKALHKPEIYYMKGVRYHTQGGIVHPGPHPEFQRAGVPTCTEEEYPVQEWQEKDGVVEKEEPKDEYNHGIDATAYFNQAVVGYEYRGGGMVENILY